MKIWVNMGLVAGLCASMNACSPQVDFYVATNGDDANPGTKTQPFASVARARDAIRQVKKDDPQRTQPMIVKVSDGTYFLKEPLVFTPEDSNTSNAPVIYYADPGRETILSGGTLITGWREVAPGRWETQLPEVASGLWNFSQLYINDQRRPRPVLPKGGYYYTAGQIAPTHGENPDRFRFHEGEIRANWHDLGAVEVSTFHLWTMDRLRIKTVDATQRVVTFTGPTHSYKQAFLSRATWYRVENVREALTQPGEWYLDRQTGVLTVLAMPGEDLSKARVIAPRLGQLVKFEGRKDAPVANILLKGLTLAHSAWDTPAHGYGAAQADVIVDGAVTAQYAQHCGLEQCVIRHTGNWAVDWSDGCQGDVVANCELFDLGVGGIKLGPIQHGREADSNKWADACIVTNNLIAHGGRVLPAGVGIWIGHAGHNQIAHNEIADFYYSGISAGWRWGAGFSPANHNLIIDNSIHDIGQGVLSDMGGIYTLGESPGTVLSGNQIHDVSRARYGGWGIYFDEGSANIRAEKNLVWRTQDAGFHQHYGGPNYVVNNIFACGTNGQIRVSKGENNDISFMQNIFSWSGPRLFEIDRITDQVVFQSNLYWRTDGAAPNFFTNAPLAVWRKREPDARVADPLFVAPKSGNFHLKSGSPAHQMGFIALDASQAGRVGRPARTANLPLVLRVFPPAPVELDLEKNLVIDDDFESYAPGQQISEFRTQTCPGDTLAVTTKLAAGGKQSLLFRKGPPGPQSWTPHLLLKVRYEDGFVRDSFDLRFESGAQLNHEWRDWPTESPYKTGPSLTLTADGVILANRKRLLILPTNQWVHIEILCGLGKQQNGTYSTTVTLPNQPPQHFDGLQYQAGFIKLTWLGFSTFGKKGTQYYLDNLKLAPVEKP